tara:strand:+ start:268 stop:369 length:102 start_codon:yes stop_codon:yes gene_type:complete
MTTAKYKTVNKLKNLFIGAIASLGKSPEKNDDF